LVICGISTELALSQLSANSMIPNSQASVKGRLQVSYANLIVVIA
jgi:hypothetical protein